MYNKELIERVCKAECHDKELEFFCSCLEEHEYDVENSFDKYYSIENIFNAIKLYQKGKISDTYLAHWACAYLWILHAESYVDSYYDTFATLPMKELIKSDITDTLDSLAFFDEDYDFEENTIEKYAKTFTDLDELYRSLPEWESCFAPDDEFYDDDIGHPDNNDYPDICCSWILFINHNKRKFIRIYDDGFNCKKDNFESREITQDEMRHLETSLKEQDYTELGNHFGYDSLYTDNDNYEDKSFNPKSFDDDMRLLYDRICNLNCSLDDLKEFNTLESDWEEGKNGEIKNFTTPYDLDEPFRKYYNPQTVLEALDMLKNKQINRYYLKEWLEAYSQILQAQTQNTIFFIDKSRKKKRHLVLKDEAIASTIAILILNMIYMLSSKKESELNNAIEALHIYTSVYRNIHDWQVVYAPISKNKIYKDGCFHQVLFFNDRIQQFFIVDPEIGSQLECYYEGVCCDKYDFEKICDDLRNRKYKEIAIIKIEQDD